MFRVLFSPRMIGLHLVAIVATAAAAWLGVWQYDAWQTHRDLQSADLAHATPRPLDQVMSPDAPFPGDSIGRPVEFRGEWVTRSSFLVGGRKHDGDKGYWVVTPVAVCDPACAPDNPAMLVVRGWTGQLRFVPPAPIGEVDINGWLQPAEGSGLPDDDPNDAILPELRIADAIQRVDQDLYGAYVISDTATAGLTEVPPPSLPAPDAFTAARNLFYAFEWWVFGGFAVFLWWRWCTDEVKRAGRVTTDDHEASPAGRETDDAGVPSSL